MTGSTCPCCNTEMRIQGDVVNGQMEFCVYCNGILASDRWLNTNMRQTVLRNLRNAVFNGNPAGYKCPTCAGEVVKGPTTTPQGQTIEVDGCLKCGSLWFDNREIEPFIPEIQDNLQGVSEDALIKSNPLSWFLRPYSSLASWLTPCLLYTSPSPRD